VTAARPSLNIDLGELPGEPEELYALADVANVACGGHAGDAVSMLAAVAMCERHGTELCAHPSFPDREGFGRVVVEMEPAALAASVRRQCEALALAAGTRTVVAMKPHGALYHEAARSQAVAAAVLDGVIAALGEVAIVGPPKGALADEAAARGLPYRREGFADRLYGSDGRLVPRSVPGATIESPVVAAQQAERLAAEGGAETMCVHGDGPSAVAVARAVREALDRLAR
jgi:UPF0271 protein